MDYCRKLEFEQEPDYKYLIDLLDQCKAAGETNNTKILVNVEPTKDLQSESSGGVTESTEVTEATKASSRKSPSARKQIRRKTKFLKNKIKVLKL